jgi:hypothetical protein
MGEHANSTRFCPAPSGIPAADNFVSKQASREVCRGAAYARKRERILALWNTGNYSMSEIGTQFGVRAGNVGAVLRGARRAGFDVLAIAPEERSRRAVRSRRLFRYGQAAPDLAAAEASLLIRTAWLSGASALRIASMLDTAELLVRAELRRLGLPPRRKPAAAGGLPP